jgi:hypothetical protein
MKIRFRVLTSVIALSICLTGLAFAYQINFGALMEDTVFEENVSFGAMRRSTLSRRPIQIPKAYGRLITITTSNTGTTLWFESQEGLIRNVNLDGAVPLVIERKGELN